MKNDDSEQVIDLEVRQIISPSQFMNVIKFGYCQLKWVISERRASWAVERTRVDINR